MTLPIMFRNSNFHMPRLAAFWKHANTMTTRKQSCVGDDYHNNGPFREVDDMRRATYDELVAALQYAIEELLYIVADLTAPIAKRVRAWRAVKKIEDILDND